MVKKFRILKDIPGFKAGDIVPTKAESIWTNTIHSFGGESVINEDYAKKYPDFFEEIIEDKTFDTLEGSDTVYFIYTNGKIGSAGFSSNDSRGEIFLTRQQAEDEHKRREWANRKDKFIPEEKEAYFSYYNGSGNIVEDSNDCHPYDIFAINQGLAFRTIEECQDAIDNHDIVRLFYTIR